MTNSAVWLARRTTSLRATTPRRSNCYTGTWGAEFFKIGPEEGEPVVVKHRYSAFAGTELMWVLRSVDRQSLLITGVATETCVESTLRDGLFHDFHVNLVEDCCASYSREAHDASVRVVHRCFGLVASSAEIVAQWESLR
jgi:nicotinamidase-related amidase